MVSNSLRTNKEHFFGTRITRISRNRTDRKNKQIRVCPCHPSNLCTKRFNANVFEVTL